jgi:hypothetical protein
MKLLRVYFHIARADLFERTRRYSFWISMLLVVYLGYLVDNGSITVSADGIRGVLNSPWIGTQMVIVCNTFLGLFGFYLVKNCITRDEQSGVGQIIATTPISRVSYLLGKWLSNLVALTLILVILSAAALVMQFRQGQAFDALGLLAPIFLLGLPMMSLVAALAVFFEVIPFLRGGFGNVAYVFVFIFGMIQCIDGLGKYYPNLEPFGVNMMVNSITPSVLALSPDFKGGVSIGFIEGMDPNLFFKWPGFVWSADVLLGRLIVFLAPLLLVFLGALFFGRFDPARSWRKPRPVKEPIAGEEASPSSSQSAGFSLWKKAQGEDAGVIKESPMRPDETLAAASLAGLGAVRYRPVFAGLVWQNLRLMVKGLPWWLYVTAGGVWVGSLAADNEAAQICLLVISLLPVLIWSRCGSREQRFETGGLIFCAPHPIGRLFWAEWTAAWLVSAVVLSGGGLHLLFNGDWSGLLALGLGSLLIPSAAMSFGIWTGSSKLFEIVYVLAWYIGLANRMPELDFLGLTTGSFMRQMPVLALGLVLGLLLMGFAGRKRLA